MLLLTPGERRRFFLLLGLGWFTALAEVAGVSSLLPFMTVVGKPGLIHSHPLLDHLYKGFGFHSDRAFLLAGGLSVFLLLTCANACSASYYWLSQRFQVRVNAQLSARLLSIYLQRPFLVHIVEGSSEASSRILNQVTLVSAGALLQLLRLSSRAMLGCVIVAGLVYVDPLVAMFSLLLFCGMYAFAFGFARQRLRQVAQERNAADRLRYKFLNEALLGVREIKLANCEPWAVSRVLTQSLRSAQATAHQQTMAEFPRYAIESIAFGGIIAILLYYIFQDASLVTMLPKLGVFTLAAYRLISALQHGFSAFSMFQASVPAIENVYNDLSSLKSAEQPVKRRSEDKARLVPTKALRLEGITFSYPGREPLFKDLTLEVLANTTVGFAGSTGAGKSTLAALILGLLEPQEGNLSVDDVVVGPHNIGSWHKSIGYVPQDIVILDDTIFCNVAFGVADAVIDREAVRTACRLANIQDFIEQSLPQGYDTLLGDRGVRLSGGQRQRIGIARALYHNPSVLIFDEATSALDGGTEAAVMEAIRGLAHQRMLLLIAHRVTTLVDCDMIFFLKDGKIAASGRYQELCANQEFLTTARIPEERGAFSTAPASTA